MTKELTNVLEELKVAAETGSALVLGPTAVHNLWAAFQTLGDAVEPKAPQIPTWRELCHEEYRDTGIFTGGMIEKFMQGEIDALRRALNRQAEPGCDHDFVWQHGQEHYDCEKCGALSSDGTAKGITHLQLNRGAES